MKETALLNVVGLTTELYNQHSTMLQNILKYTAPKYPSALFQTDATLPTMREPAWSQLDLQLRIKNQMSLEWQLTQT